MLGQIVPNVLLGGQSILNDHAVGEANAFKGLPIEPCDWQRAMATQHGGIALPGGRVVSAQ